MAKPTEKLFGKLYKPRRSFPLRVFQCTKRFRIAGEKLKSGSTNTHEVFLSFCSLPFLRAAGLAQHIWMILMRWANSIPGGKKIFPMLTGLRWPETAPFCDICIWLKKSNVREQWSCPAPGGQLSSGGRNEGTVGKGASQSCTGDGRVMATTRVVCKKAFEWRRYYWVWGTAFAILDEQSTAARLSFRWRSLSEDFKLDSGTWVNALGTLRAKFISGVCAICTRRGVVWNKQRSYITCDFGCFLTGLIVEPLALLTLKISNCEALVWTTLCLSTPFRQTKKNLGGGDFH